MSVVPVHGNISAIAQIAKKHNALKVVLNRNDRLDGVENYAVISGFDGAFKLEFVYTRTNTVETNLHTAVTKATCATQSKLVCTIDEDLIGAILTSAAGDDNKRQNEAARFMETLGEFVKHIGARDVSPDDESVFVALKSLINAAGCVCDALEQINRGNLVPLLPMKVSSKAHQAITNERFRNSGVPRVKIVDVMVPAAAKNPFDDDTPRTQLPVYPVAFNPFL